MYSFFFLHGCMSVSCHSTIKCYNRAVINGHKDVGLESASFKTILHGGCLKKLVIKEKIRRPMVKG